MNHTRSQASQENRIERKIFRAPPEAIQREKERMEAKRKARKSPAKKV